MASYCGYAMPATLCLICSYSIVPDLIILNFEYMIDPVQFIDSVRNTH